MSHSTLVCDHAPAADPRMAGTCVKCGSPLAKADPARDLQFESRFLQDSLELALRLTGVSNELYPRRVNQRLALGRERYGEGTFLRRDNLVEVLEETPDLAAYAMLELQRQRVLGLGNAAFEELRLDLVAVAAYGAVADYYAQRASLRARG